MDFLRRETFIANVWLIFFIAAVSCYRPAASKNDFLITGRSIGRLDLGQSKDAAIRVTGLTGRFQRIGEELGLTWGMRFPM